MGNMIVSVGKKVIKQLTSIEYSLVFSRPYDGQVHVLSLECAHDKQAGEVNQSYSETQRKKDQQRTQKIRIKNTSFGLKIIFCPLRNSFLWDYNCFQQSFIQNLFGHR